MGIKVKQTRIELLPEGAYEATIGDIEAAEGRYGPQLKFTFNLLEPQGKTLSGWCSQSFNVKSKLYAWARAAFGGRDIPPGWDLDCDKLLDRRVLLVVGKEKGTDGTEFNKIKDLLPIGTPRIVQAPSAPQPAIEAPAATNGAEDDWLAGENSAASDIPF